MDKLFILVSLAFFIGIASNAQVFTDSNLPIVIIKTDNAMPIPDEPKVPGSMKIIFKGPGVRNYVADQDTTSYLDYHGRIGIEIRGSYSSIFPKKGYGFTTRMADDITNNNISLLGMPSENDWILNSIISDPSLIRDYLSYHLSRELGVYASRTAYCEVVINGIYKGLYILEEKIKADKDRVDITKILTTDNNFPAVTGGYITKSDKTTGGDPIAWYMSSIYGSNDVWFIHDWPKPAEVTWQQTNYIKSVFESLKTTAAANNASVSNGYPSIIDIPSFIDYMLINELSSNADAYQYSTFYHKDRNGKLRAGPAWDLNLTYGNDLFELGYDRSKTDVWQFSNGSNVGPKYWFDLFNNTQYKCYLSKRWNELILPGNPLNLTTIFDFIDTTVAYISEAVVRENALWGLVGNHQYQISLIKTFLNARNYWITGHIGPYSNCSNVATPPLVISKIMYNPATSVSFPSSDDQEFIEITNTGSSSINLTGIYFSETGLVYQFPPNSFIMANSAIILASNSATFQAKYNFAPFGQYTRNLSNKDYDIILADGFGNVIDNVHYYDDAPWPDADGNGKYLQLTDVNLDNNLASSWVASNIGGLGIENNTNIPKLLIFPNPVIQILSIKAGKPLELLQIIDMQGRVLESVIVNSDRIDLDMNNYASGVYVLKAITQGETLIGRIVKE